MYNVYDQDNNLIDTLTVIEYLRYLPRANKLINTDSSSANCVRSSDRKQIYALQGKLNPAVHKYTIVSLELVENITANVTTSVLNKVKQDVIQVLKKQCQDEITHGVTIKLRDTLYEFELTIEDQLNLRSIKSRLDGGCETVIYHAKNRPCEAFTRDQMLSVIRAAESHIQYHTTYFNLLKYCINNMNNIKDVQKVRYGDPLPSTQQQILNMAI